MKPIHQQLQEVLEEDLLQMQQALEMLGDTVHLKETQEHQGLAHQQLQAEAAEEQAHQLVMVLEAQLAMEVLDQHLILLGHLQLLQESVADMQAEAAEEHISMEVQEHQAQQHMEEELVEQIVMVEEQMAQTILEAAEELLVGQILVG